MNFCPGLSEFYTWSFSKNQMHYVSFCEFLSSFEWIINMKFWQKSNALCKFLWISVQFWVNSIHEVLATIMQPFYSVNSLLVTHSNLKSKMQKCTVTGWGFSRQEASSYAVFGSWKKTCISKTVHHEVGKTPKRFAQNPHKSL